jgi:hypothetical protein
MIGMGEMQASLWSLQEDGKSSAPPRKAVKAEDSIKAEAVQ